MGCYKKVPYDAVIKKVLPVKIHL